MRVKINDIWYSSAKDNIAIDMTDGEKKSIQELPKNHNVYAVHHDMTTKEALAWMAEDKFNTLINHGNMVGKINKADGKDLPDKKTKSKSK